MDESCVPELGNALADLREKDVDHLLGRALDAGTPPLQIIDALAAGMDTVGRRYRDGEYFLTELIFSGQIFKNAMSRLQPVMRSGCRRQRCGTLIMGTVKGDIHDLGKNIVITLLECAGFEVIDLGVDVPPETFVATLRESRVSLIGLSGLVTTAFDSMKETVKAITQAGLRESVTIMIGGGPTSENVKTYVGADFYGPDAPSAVELAKRVVK